MRPEKLSPDDPRLADTLQLIRDAFSAHDGRIDPPSSMHKLTLQGLAESARSGELWILGERPFACVILQAKTHALYLSKLAVREDARGHGHARQLIELADARARTLGLPSLELQTRIELVENHAAFEKLGFVMIAETCHPGFDRPTSILMRKTLAAELR